MELLFGPSLACWGVIIWSKYGVIIWSKWIFSLFLSGLKGFCTLSYHFVFLGGPVIRQFSKNNVFLSKIGCEIVFRILYFEIIFSMFAKTL